MPRMIVIGNGLAGAPAGADPNLSGFRHVTAARDRDDPVRRATQPRSGQFAGRVCQEVSSQLRIAVYEGSVTEICYHDIMFQKHIVEPVAYAGQADQKRTQREA
jgi:hypothetical protein